VGARVDRSIGGSTTQPRPSSFPFPPVTMASLLGPISGALVAGGFYYGYSSLMHNRTESLKTELHTLSVRLVDHPALVMAPPSAAARVTPPSFAATLKARWNDEVAGLAQNLRGLDGQVGAWGRRVVYGDQHTSK
ncbi:unnamed protein product, partial [Mycena citricolor]